MIRMDYIQEFVKLADRLSFSRASEDLFITQPSLSRHISLLESELGVKLVNRSTRSVEMTRAGSELCKDFIRLLEDYQSVQEHAKALASGYYGRLSISTTPNWLTEHLEPLILEFSQRYPDIKVEVNVCPAAKTAEMLWEGRSDLAIGFESEAKKSDIASKKLFEERLCVVMPADHPLAGKDSVSLRELAGEEFVVLELDETRAKVRTAGENLLIRNGIDPSKLIRSSDLATVGLTIQQTGAVCILMESLGNLGRSYLTAVPLSDPDYRLPLYLLKKKSNEDRMVNAFFDMAPTC